MPNNSLEERKVAALESISKSLAFVVNLLCTPYKFDPRGCVNTPDSFNYADIIQAKGWRKDAE